MGLQIWVMVAVVVFTLWCSVCLAAVLPLEQPGMGVRVEAGDYTVMGRKVRVARSVEVRIAPPERVKVTGEEVVLGEERPSAYIGATVLAKTLGPVDRGTRYPKAIDPASVRVYSAGPDAAVYEEGKDYVLDHDWGGPRRHRQRVGQPGPCRDPLRNPFSERD